MESVTIADITAQSLAGVLTLAERAAGVGRNRADSIQFGETKGQRARHFGSVRLPRHWKSPFTCILQRKGGVQRKDTQVNFFAQDPRRGSIGKCELKLS